MVVRFAEKDMDVIKQMAESYNLSTADFAKAIVRQTRKDGERQFRINDEEFVVISENAKENGLTMMKQCEICCTKFLARMKVGKIKESDVYVVCKKREGGRTKRVAMKFTDKKIEKRFEDAAVKIGVDIGALIRYCALNYN